MELKCNNIEKSFGKFQGVQKFSITLTPGLWGLLGPNGSGKTTLIRMLVGNSKPTKGEILWNGERIENDLETYLSHIGYLPQNFGVDKNFTVYDFLWYMGLLKDMEKNVLEHRISELLDQFNLAHVRKKNVTKLSGGMKRRLGICQALLNDPDILVVDEPTAGLDIDERRRFRRYLSKLGENKIIILSTHIVSDVEFIANDFIFLRKGELILQGEARELIQTMEGRVYEGNIEQSVKLDTSKIVNERVERDGKQMVRYIGDHPISGSHLVEPSLGDLYIHLYGEEMQ